MMLNEDLNSLPSLNSFEELKHGDAVYSKKYGVGKIFSLYNDEVIVQFSNVRQRLSVHDGLSKIPERHLQKPQKTKVEIVYDGKYISFKELKQKNREEAKRKKVEEEIRRDERRRARVLNKANSKKL